MLILAAAATALYGLYLGLGPYEGCRSAFLPEYDCRNAPLLARQLLAGSALLVAGALGVTAFFTGRGTKQDRQGGTPARE